MYCIVLHKVQVICRESGKEWTTIDATLWSSSVDTIAQDFTVTQLKYECTEVESVAVTSTQSTSAFDVLMNARKRTFLPDKRITRFVITLHLSLLY